LLTEDKVQFDGDGAEGPPVAGLRPDSGCKEWVD